VIDKSQRVQKLHLPIRNKCWCCCWNRTCYAHQRVFPMLQCSMDEMKSGDFTWFLDNSS